MGSGKKGPPKGAPPPPLLEPETFWSGEDDAPEEIPLDLGDLEEETTQPAMIAPPGTPSKPHNIADDEEIATVGLDDFIPPKTASALPPRRPGSVPSRARAKKPAAPHPLRDYSAAAPAEEPVVLIDESIGLKKAFVYLLGVALVFGFLGWFLIGRHAGQETAKKDDPILEDEISEKTTLGNPSKNDSAAKVETEKKVQADAGIDKGSEPTQAAAVVQEKVFIEVSSEPIGADVFVDGAKTGTTPTTIKGVKSRELRLRLYLAGYQPWEKVLDLQGDEIPKKLSITLEKKKPCEDGTGFISISSMPSGAKIEVDGDQVPGHTPTVVNDVCAGRVLHLTVSKDRYRPWKKDVTVKQGDILSVKAELEKGGED